ncbi:hypothetical protein KSP40_PGU000170 [Platanthera guangdongensis]|uniref:Uncharacterized protein n=1 Tax=Platanthera guangdongensis TaxID=2320717 RepID=A0ABR2LGR8_9ASPA
MARTPRIILEDDYEFIKTALDRLDILHPYSLSKLQEWSYSKLHPCSSDKLYITGFHLLSPLAQPWIMRGFTKYRIRPSFHPDGKTEICKQKLWVSNSTKLLSRRWSTAQNQTFWPDYSSLLTRESRSRSLISSHWRLRFIPRDDDSMTHPNLFHSSSACFSSTVTRLFVTRRGAILLRWWRFLEKMRLSRLENLGIKNLSGKAKIIGSLVGVAGATILTFLKGMELNFSTSVNLLKPHSNGGHDQTVLHYESGDRIMGSILVVASYFSYSIWLIIQVENKDSLERWVTPEQAMKVCNRNFGVGADGVIFAMLGLNDIDYSMRIFNSDGSEPEEKLKLRQLNQGQDKAPAMVIENFWARIDNTNHAGGSNQIEDKVEEKSNSETYQLLDPNCRIDSVFARS